METEEIRKHLKEHCDALGWHELRRKVQKAGGTGETRKVTSIDIEVVCPWCDANVTQLGGLNRHIVDRHLKVNSKVCPCGGTNSRSNQKNNRERHYRCLRHQNWVRGLTEEERGKIDSEVLGPEFEEGSSKGSKRAHRS